MATTSRSLEVTIISGENLRVDRTRPVKKNAFVVVRTDSSPISQSTNLDIDGGSYPTWNQTLLVDMPGHARFLNVDVQCRSNSGDKVVGTARIPASDFAGGYFPENYLHFLSYRLRDSGGERNGIVNLSVRVKVPEGSGRVAAASSAANSCSQSRPWMGVSAVGKVSGGIVSGVPVWSRYY
ncbi:BON1-associated protein 2-like [Camellia sinensis]|uniref:BON1-associated protein 2-like n=1 Tax=Camellia sinensis TaxID=4442 RepID=UPI0010357451|nr:BON1-associated protein 2-like [Camellia sinensis]